MYKWFHVRLAVINSSPPNKANFVHWIDMDDLKLLVESGHGSSTLNIVWGAARYTVAEVIDDANNNMSSSSTPHKRLNPSTWGYILAAKDCDQFALYRDFILKKLLEIQCPHKTKGLLQGEKYQFLNDRRIIWASSCRQRKVMKVNISILHWMGRTFYGWRWATITNNLLLKLKSAPARAAHPYLLCFWQLPFLPIAFRQLFIAQLQYYIRCFC